MRQHHVPSRHDTVSDIIVSYRNWRDARAARAVGACVAHAVLQGATAPLVEAGVPAALVFALRCAVEASDAARTSLFATAILALLHAIDFSDKASRLEISNQLVQAGFIQVASTVAATRGDAMSSLRGVVFYAFSKLNLLSWPSMYCLPRRSSPTF